ncbi:putative reverse transcriptase domain-containing protein [Tanacetum coccineum]|uniref:Reverse transcriptase domain-containing protein n=1 Tax=Tanacetum coccineum TaxID=301880 RepID=A0ABQ4XFI3_9ASTR
MSSATSAVTYTSVYTDSEPGRAFWGADDEEISEGGIPRVIVLGYDGLPMQPVAPPSPDYIPGPEDPQTPPVPQDEDEREPMFVQAHDPDYVPEPIYPEYIPLEDEHEFPAEEQPLPPVDSPTAESPGYVTESDPEEDPEEYEDDETEDGPVDYPMDGGDDGDDDDGDSSRDDANDEDEDDEDEEEEEEHLAPADSAIVVPVDEPVFPPEGTEPVIPPPSTDITIGARITVRPQTSISLPPEAEVERLLTMTTPSPSPPISLSPPSAGERLASYYRITTTSTTTTTTLHHLYTIPPPVDRRMISPRVHEQPPRKRLHLSTLGSRYEVGESSTARPTRGRGIDYGFVSTIDAEERRQGIRDVGYGIRDTWVDPAEAVPEIAPNGRGAGRGLETVWMVEEEAYASREAWAHSIGLSQATHQELQTHRDHVYAHETYLQAHQTQLQLQAAQDQMKERLTGQDSVAQEARIPDHQEASGDADSHIPIRQQKVGVDSSRNNHGHPQQPFKRQNVAKAYNIGTGERKPYGGSLPKCNKCHLHHNGPCTQRCHKCNKIGHFARDCRNTGNTNVANTQKGNGATPKGNGCFEVVEHRDTSVRLSKLRIKKTEMVNAQGWVYACLGWNAENKRGNAPGT